MISQRCTSRAEAAWATAERPVPSRTSPRASARSHTVRSAPRQPASGPVRKASASSGWCGSVDSSDSDAEPVGPLSRSTSDVSSARRSPASSPVSGTGVPVSCMPLIVSTTRSDLVRQRR